MWKGTLSLPGKRTVFFLTISFSSPFVAIALSNLFFSKAELSVVFSSMSLESSINLLDLTLFPTSSIILSNFFKSWESKGPSSVLWKIGVTMLSDRLSASIFTQSPAYCNFSRI